MKKPSFGYETKIQADGFKVIAGCDEAGRGPLAGPVVAASVILDPSKIKAGKWTSIRDSKLLSHRQRDDLASFIKEQALDFGIAAISAEVIDEINILEASLLAMKQSVEKLKLKPDFVFVDGRQEIKNLNLRQQAVIGGDNKILSVAAASILAKVERDRILCELHELYPEYGFMIHKGYPTRQHREAILKFGPSPIHRKTFGVVKLMQL